MSKASEIAWVTEDMATTAARIRAGLMFAKKLMPKAKGDYVVSSSSFEGPRRGRVEIERVKAQRGGQEAVEDRVGGSASIRGGGSSVNN